MCCLLKNVDDISYLVFVKRSRRVGCGSGESVGDRSPPKVLFMPTLVVTVLKQDRFITTII